MDTNRVEEQARRHRPAEPRETVAVDGVDGDAPGLEATRARYEIFVEKSEQPLAAEAELSKAMALAAAATASFGVVKIFSDVSHRVIATYVTNTKGEPVLI